MNGDQANNPFDGSAWATSTYRPEDYVDPAWLSLPAECCPRRPTFTEGRSFVDGRGNLWFLPVLGPESYDRFESIRQFMERTQEEVEAGRPNGDRGSIEQAQQATMMLMELIIANYEADVDAFGSLMAGVMTGRAVEPIAVMMAGLMEHFQDYCAAFLADRNGWSRADALTAARSPLPPMPMRGFFDHDGVIFDN
jgi:hypothetical protein